VVLVGFVVNQPWQRAEDYEVVTSHEPDQLELPHFLQFLQLQLLSDCEQRIETRL
jgi:hypothetical protein